MGCSCNSSSGMNSSPMPNTYGSSTMPNTSGGIQSWYDLQSYAPRNPLDLIWLAQIYDGTNTDTGVFMNSSTYSTPPSSWSASPFTFNGLPAAITNETAKPEKIIEQTHWNFTHLTRNTSSLLAPALRNLIFLHGGIEWSMNIPLTLGPGSYSDLQLSFLENAGTRGDYLGTIPVISFTARAYTGNVTLRVITTQMGKVSMGLRAIDGSSNWSMFNMDWVIVP